MSDDPVLTYRPAPTLVSVKDADRTILIHPQKGQSWSFVGVSAVIWDLVSLSYPIGKLIPFLSELLNEPPEYAVDTLRSVIQEWETEGIVQPVRGSGRG